MEINDLFKYIFYFLAFLFWLRGKKKAREEKRSQSPPLRTRKSKKISENIEPITTTSLDPHPSSLKKHPVYEASPYFPEKSHSTEKSEIVDIKGFDFSVEKNQDLKTNINGSDQKSGNSKFKKRISNVSHKIYHHRKERTKHHGKKYKSSKNQLSSFIENFSPAQTAIIFLELLNNRKAIKRSAPLKRKFKN